MSADTALRRRSRGSERTSGRGATRGPTHPPTRGVGLLEVLLALTLLAAVLAITALQQGGAARQLRRVHHHQALTELLRSELAARRGRPRAAECVALHAAVRAAGYRCEARSRPCPLGPRACELAARHALVPLWLRVEAPDGQRAELRTLLDPALGELLREGR